MKRLLVLMCCHNCDETRFVMYDSMSDAQHHDDAFNKAHGSCAHKESVILKVKVATRLPSS